MTTDRQKRLRLIIAVGTVALAGAAAATWLLSARPPSPTETAVVGIWHSPQEPDGSSTEVVLNRDRTCRVRWLNAAGEDDPTQPPRSGRWWVEGSTVVVDTRRPQWLPGRGRTPWWKWSFEVAGDTLVHGSDSGAPVVLRRPQTQANVKTESEAGNR